MIWHVFGRFGRVPKLVVAIPALYEFLDTGYIDDSVMEVMDEFGHFGVEEGFVGVHSVTR